MIFSRRFCARSYDAVFDVSRYQHRGGQSHRLAINFNLLSPAQVRFQRLGNRCGVSISGNPSRQFDGLVSSPRFLKSGRSRFQIRPKLLEKEFLPAFALEFFQRLRIAFVELPQKRRGSLRRIFTRIIVERP